MVHVESESGDACWNRAFPGGGSARSMCGQKAVNYNLIHTRLQEFPWVKL